MTVRAHLDGNPIDLQILADLFPTGDTRIVRDSDGAYLEATALDQWFTDGGRLREEADRILTRLMGAARHRNGSFRAVRLTGRFDRDARSQILAEDTFTFREEHTVASTGVAEMRAVAYAVAGVTDSASTPPPLPRGHRLLALMDAHQEVEELMTLLGSSDGLEGPEGPSWPDLYRAFEIVRGAVGGEKGLKALGFADKRISLFTQTAQPYRHARLSGTPPKVPMAKAEGEEFVRQITDAWLATLTV